MRSACVFALVLATLGSPAPPAASEELPDLTRLEATRTRPIFAPNRRPPAPPPDVRPAPPPEAPPVVDAAPPVVELRGVILGEGRRFAIVQRGGEPKPVTVQTGSRIDGWTVQSIAPRELTLGQDKQKVTIGLQRH